MLHVTVKASVNVFGVHQKEIYCNLSVTNYHLALLSRATSCLATAILSRYFPSRMFFSYFTRYRNVKLEGCDTLVYKVEKMFRWFFAPVVIPFRLHLHLLSQQTFWRSKFHDAVMTNTFFHLLLLQCLLVLFFVVSSLYSPSWKMFIQFSFRFDFISGTNKMYKTFRHPSPIKYIYFKRHTQQHRVHKHNQTIDTQWRGKGAWTW